ncbi:MAG: cyclic pyranopterin monophosphate synthase MoaC, partial [Opitutaceae bacterium]
PLALTGASGECSVARTSIRVRAAARSPGQTGAEVRALTAVPVAAPPVYGMCKAVDKAMSIEGIRVVEKIKA